VEPSTNDRATGQSSRPFKTLYSWIASTSVNILIMFIALNIAISLFAGTATKEDALRDEYLGWRRDVGTQQLRQVEPNRAEYELLDAGRRKHGIGFVFEPYVQFKTESGYTRIGPSSTDWVAVHPTGFRILRADQGQWPPPGDAVSVFYISGTVSVGRNIGVGQSVPALIQESLRGAWPDRPVYVYDFSTTGHNSEQSRLYLESLLMRGWVPDVAIFADGPWDLLLEDGDPYFTNWWRDRFIQVHVEGYKHPTLWYLKRLLIQSPFGRLIESYKRNVDPADLVADRPIVSTPSVSALGRTDQAGSGVVRRYVANKAMSESIADAFGSKAFFVWQPLPPDGRSTTDSAADVAAVTLRTGYARAKAYFGGHPQGANFRLCADRPSDEDAAAERDGAVGPTPVSNERLASCILKVILAATRSTRQEAATAPVRSSKPKRAD